MSASVSCVLVSVLRYPKAVISASVNCVLVSVVKAVISTSKVVPSFKVAVKLLPFTAKLFTGLPRLMFD